MTDPIPQGYLSIPEARNKVRDAIAGHEDFSEWARGWIGEPATEVDRASRRQAARHELSLEMIWVAFRRGDISAYARPPAGEVFRIPQEDWLLSSGWEVWLGSGVVRVPSHCALFAHEGRRLFVGRAEFEKWISRKAKTLRLASSPSQTPNRRNVTIAQIADYVCSVADGNKSESELRKLTEIHFNCRIPDNKNQWRPAFAMVPEEKKRSRGNPRLKSGNQIRQ